MKRSNFVLKLSSSLLAIVALVACNPASKESKDKDSSNFARAWCISGGPIYTGLDANPVAEAIAIRQGEIKYVGAATGEWCKDHAGANSQKIDIKNGAAYPGFTDAHGHLIGIGLREMTLNLAGTSSISDLQTRVKAALEDLPAGETLFGRGWIETHWPEDRFPTRQDLDKISPDNPVILERADGHASVVNSAALDKANITRETEAPFGGAIHLDAAGEPTGMLIDNAANLVEPLMPKLTRERKRQAYITGAELYASRGWTNIHSMSVDPADIQMINRLARQRKIKIRVYNSLDLFPSKARQTMADIDDMKNVKNDLVTTQAIKLYSDGALGSRGAALLEPYSDDEKNSGLILLKKENAESILDAALRSGTQVNTHAIGDRANRLVLDWYDAAFKRVPKNQWGKADPRWRIEHSQIIDLRDLPRYAELGVIPSMQPSHAIGDLHFAPARLGKNRLSGAYAWRALIESGAIIAGGTDAPVEVGDPRIEIYAATQRRDLSGFNNEDWNEEQKVSPQDALKMFTIWPAYAAFQDGMIGTLEVGKKADISIFKTDILTVDGPDILKAEPLVTMVDGRLAFDGRDK